MSHLTYTFTLLDTKRIVVDVEEFTSDQVENPFDAFDNWVAEQKGLSKSVVQATLCVSHDMLDTGLVLKSVDLTHKEKTLQLRDYLMIERVNAIEFIEADVNHEHILTKMEVRVIDGESSDAWIFAFDTVAGIFYSIHCYNLTQTLQVLSLGNGKCSPSFIPGFDGFELSDDMTDIENEAWITYLTK